MKKLLLVLLAVPFFVFAQGKKPPRGVVYDTVITRIIDGDTVAIEAGFLPPPLKPELSVRIYGIDTPEKGHRAQCAEENALGQAATELTKKSIANSRKRQVFLISWDKYGGRVLGDIILDGRSLREILIANGVAREYYGAAKTSWCK
jgi:endonuclease YncB( thermonuclease family)